MKRTETDMILDRVLASKTPPILDKNGIVQNDVDAVTTIAGRRVLMEEFLVYSALKQGDYVTPDGKLAGVRPRQFPGGEVNAMLEKALRQRTMRQELLRLIEEQQKQ